jgi:type IV secretion system protein VirD4
MLNKRGLHGFVFGTKGKDWIIRPESEDGHILVVGGVGSGKSSCLAIPSLRSWNQRVFVIDVKGELYEKTSSDRQEKIKKFDPLDKSAYGYDPYYLMFTSDNPVQEAQAISEAILPLSPDIKDPYWINSAKRILTGAILYYYEDTTFIGTLEKILLTEPIELIKTISESVNRKAKLFIRACCHYLITM